MSEAGDNMGDFNVWSAGANNNGPAACTWLPHASCGHWLLVSSALALAQNRWENLISPVLRLCQQLLFLHRYLIKICYHSSVGIRG